MKLVSQEEQQEHYNATIKGGWVGGITGLVAGSAAVTLAARRYPGFKNMNLPFHAFLAGSAATFGSIVTADHYARAWELEKHPEKRYVDNAAKILQQTESAKPQGERIREWATVNRYKIVGGSWVASIIAAFAIVNRNKYLTGQQKLVQARVYAQGLTLAVLLASFALEANDRNKGRGRWETVMVLDPDDPEHKHMIEKRVHHEAYKGEDQWKDMVEAEEQRLKEHEEAKKRRHEKAHSKEAKSTDSSSKESSSKESSSKDSQPKKPPSKDAGIHSVKPMSKDEHLTRKPAQEAENPKKPATELGKSTQAQSK
jgi:hypothetical protein